MRNALIGILFLLYSKYAYAQNSQFDSLKNLIRIEKDDSIKFYRIADLIWAYLYSNEDSAASYIQQNILLAQKMNSEPALERAYGQYWIFEQLNGNYSGALQYALQSFRAAERRNDFISISETCFTLGDIYRETGDFEKALYYLRKAKLLLESKLNPVFAQEKNELTISHYIFCLTNFAQTFEAFDGLDSALKYAKNAQDLYLRKYGDDPFFSRILALIMGNIYSKAGDYSTALSYYRSGATIASRDHVEKDVMDNYGGAANTFKRMGQFDSSILYANKVLDLSKVVRNMTVKLEALNLLANVYKLKHNADSVAKYLELTIETKDSLFNKRKATEMQSITMSEMLRLKEIKEQQQQYQFRLRTYLLTGGLIMVLLLAGILYRNNQQKQKARIKIEKAYKELKATQAQLIQSEKMASLGELTAGIAHEIQNPLNFVNNFSEVNRELIEELEVERRKVEGERNEELENQLLNDLKQNLEKIDHHGKRADSIVKGMMHHSQISSGQKELTDINALAGEYLRISYHGMRAKDKSFNATLQTQFDKNLEKLSVIPQDIGRALLNLYNNAFYSMMEKVKLNPQGYEPTISVATHKQNGKLTITVKDNGTGIPENIKDKVFQPFFTTKAAGTGTGLGLSISYDIITKEHGGEIRAESREGEGAEFVILLPV